jgi:hypothetical protein
MRDGSRGGATVRLQHVWADLPWSWADPLVATAAVVAEGRAVRCGGRVPPCHRVAVAAVLS